jgi:hypothetical protein
VSKSVRSFIVMTNRQCHVCTKFYCNDVANCVKFVPSFVVMTLQDVSSLQQVLLSWRNRQCKRLNIIWLGFAKYYWNKQTEHVKLSTNVDAVCYVITTKLGTNFDAVCYVITIKLGTNIYTVYYVMTTKLGANLTQFVTSLQ